MFDRKAFDKEKLDFAEKQARDEDLQRQALELNVAADKYNYGYQWNWLGMPVIQLPADIVAVQEILWETKPTIVIETGIAWGGSIVYYASILQLLGEGRVIGVDRVLPEKNIREIMKYPFSDRIKLYHGSSTDPEMFEKIKSHIGPDDRVMVLLDSNHTHEHVLDELRLYAPLVSKGQFLVVSDTCVEQFPVQEHRPRPWGPGNNPQTALNQYMGESDRFEVDPYIDKKLLLTFTPHGYLRCVK